MHQSFYHWDLSLTPHETGELEWPVGLGWGTGPTRKIYDLAVDFTGRMARVGHGVGLLPNVLVGWGRIIAARAPGVTRMVSDKTRAGALRPGPPGVVDSSFARVRLLHPEGPHLLLQSRKGGVLIQTVARQVLGVGGDHRPVGSPLEDARGVEGSPVGRGIVADRGRHLDVGSRRSSALTPRPVRHMAVPRRSPSSRFRVS